MRTITLAEKEQAHNALRDAIDILRLEDAGTGIGEELAAQLNKIDRRLQKTVILQGVLVDRGGTVTVQL